MIRRILAALLVASGLAACAGVTGCAVGVRGSAAVIEISGPGAGVACARMISQDGATYFATDPQESKPIVCVVPVGTLKYTVRDQGMLLVQGNAVCNSLTITPEAPAPTETEWIMPTFEVYPTMTDLPIEPTWTDLPTEVPMSADQQLRIQRLLNSILLSPTWTDVP